MNYLLGEEYNVFIDDLQLNLVNNLNSIDIARKTNVVNQISWITKSLALKGHSRMIQWIDLVSKKYYFMMFNIMILL